MSKIIYPSFIAILEMLRKQRLQGTKPKRTLEHWEILSHQKQAGTNYETN